MKFNLRLSYLYLFSFVGLLITIIGSIQILDLGLKTYVFKVSEYTYYAEPIKSPDGISTDLSVEEQKQRNQLEQANQRKRQLSTSLSMILVGVPVYLYHWKTIKKENRPEN
ncbi:MAG: hypothetical protein UX08_C0002G0047 [Candidatus Collierbacteria bacterium GW2011_GWB1_45_35]|uniref:DUF5671 domain-containing protein n=2 Tax=Candidatus Collieribacteriota TaxID=1752725 RepID=A0A0G1KPN0_9BACT|nr:MAG: hypothetical protein UW48_C0004G0058 [Microgenomates group bacterium GW2011_GWC1_44_23]KKT85445.1 MAG: hypothetical protein UW84_C0031G0003 [Candidatus Collierbacteria bacterium GW2011_GWA2_44_99]KKT95734.1 MAG: hypothetical protein UW96_C0005G0058 [Candidatus Collierbacteria bacterium GW2011_GWA1_45_15]KKU00381.1 MAG: hypothetical protein UX01_C0005G0058 [Candidatus Collierbacteria bacterium GW2011_GWB2_45_17]KKU05832.1 MAG: hypothetical protein UX08_C0002G0047 [Candidatus Collierbacte